MKPDAHLYRSSVLELRAANIHAFLGTAEEGVDGGDLAREFSRWAESEWPPSVRHRRMQAGKSCTYVMSNVTLLTGHR